MGEKGVVFKASTDGLVIVFDPQEKFEQIYEQLERKLNSAGFFFQSRLFAATYRGRKLTTEEEQKISRMMAEKTGAKTVIFEIDRNYMTDEHRRPTPEMTAEGTQNSRDQEQVQEPEPYLQTTPDRPAPVRRRTRFADLDECMTKFHKGTLRSGKFISYEGNVVVIGDVNPGAEVEATGNIVVVGTLRGIVHAGASGNKEACVVALNLQPTQLRIADIITRMRERRPASQGIVPEQAYIKDDAIVIETFLMQYK